MSAKYLDPEALILNKLGGLPWAVPLPSYPGSAADDPWWRRHPPGSPKGQIYVSILIIVCFSAKFYHHLRTFLLLSAPPAPAPFSCLT